MREWLKTLRNEKKLTMKEIGAKLGVSESYYCAIENGDRQKNMDLMFAAGVADILGISVAEVVANEQAERMVVDDLIGEKEETDHEKA